MAYRHHLGLPQQPEYTYLDDFLPSALSEAATAMGYQRAGFRILQLSAQAGTAAAGPLGTFTAAQLGKALDLHASRAIASSAFSLAISPM